MNVGIIGTGNMGSILIEALITSKALHPSNIVITNRTKAKANRIKAQYNDIHVVTNASDVTKMCDIIFICVRPNEIFPLLDKVSHQLHEEQVLISITSPILTEELESVVPCQIARIIPSITNRALTGATLVTFGERITEKSRGILLSLVERFSRPIFIEEINTRVASDIVSCGPAFISYLVQRSIDGAVQQTEISREQATELMSEMLIGLGKLLEKNIYSLETLQEKVSVQGGVTGIGIQVLEEEVGQMFHNLYKATRAKYATDRKEIAHQLSRL